MSKEISKLFIEEESMRCLLCYDAPCSKVCPAQTDPAKFIRSIRFKNYLGGIKTIRENNAFGATCSDICNGERYCEKACLRNKIDKPISIKYMQKFLMEMEKVSDNKEIVDVSKGEVCIFGGDIKALSSASEFIKHGYKVTLFTALSIKEYLKQFINDGSLSEDLLEKDIKSILNKGLQVKNYIPSIEEIEKYSFKAVLFASEDVKNIKFNNKELKDKSYYIDKLVSGPNDVVFSIKLGKEAAKKIIKEIE